MNRIFKFTLFTVALLASIAFVGCTEDVAIDPPAIVGGDGARFSFVVDDLDVAIGDQEESIGTRAAADEPSAEIKNMWVVQYKADDTFIDRHYYDSYTSVDDFEIDDAASKIVFIANTFKSDLVPDKITLDDLKALITTDVTTTDGTNKYFILSGTYDATKNESTVYLRRNVAKVNIAVTRAGLDNTYTLTDITVYNVASTSRVYTNYTGVGAIAATSVTSYKLTEDELTAAATGSGATIYLPANEQGKQTSNSSSQDKVKNAPVDATYVVVKYGYNSVTSVDEFSSDFGIRSYTFYLGKDMTTDYNISPNYAYNYSFDIDEMGNHMTDLRIESNDIMYIQMANASDIYRWKERNKSNTDAIANYNNIGKDYINFKYTVGEVKGTNWMSTSEVIVAAAPNANGIATKDVSTHYITANTTYVSDDVLPKLQAICGKSVELPTQKELMYMWVFKGSNSFQSGDYWSSSVGSGSRFRWFVGFIFGLGSTNYTFAYHDDRYARAVREIELPQAD